MTGTAIELIRNTAISNINFVIWYSFAITVTALIVVINKRKRTLKYKTWKTETINIGVWKREWEANKDVVVQQLWDENQRLEDEVKVLTKKYRNLSFSAFCMALLFIVALLFSYFLKRRK